MAVMSLALGTAGGLSFVSAVRDGRIGGWVWAGVCFGILLPWVVYGVNRMLGTTVLSSAGMRFSTFGSRRLIPWDQITKIEVRPQGGRGKSGQEVRAHRSSGRPLVIPGVMHSLSADSTAEVEEKVRAICSHWEEATGQPQGPVYTR